MLCLRRMISPGGWHVGVCARTEVYSRAMFLLPSLGLTLILGAALIRGYCAVGCGWMGVIMRYFWRLSPSTYLPTICGGVPFLTSVGAFLIRFPLGLASLVFPFLAASRLWLSHFVVFFHYHIIRNPCRCCGRMDAAGAFFNFAARDEGTGRGLGAKAMCSVCECLPVRCGAPPRARSSLYFCGFCIFVLLFASFRSGSVVHFRDGLHLWDGSFAACCGGCLFLVVRAAESGAGLRGALVWMQFRLL